MNRGLVVDFVILQAGPLRTGVFNVADVAIIAGVILIGLSPFTQRQQDKP
jgi:signal peptidase II